jgi:hypothetical protein
VKAINRIKIFLEEKNDLHKKQQAYFFKKHGNMQNIIALFSFATQRCAKSFRYFGRKPGETADYEKVPASCKKAENIFNTGGIGAL